MGSIEVDYEGSEDFLREELPDLLAAVSELYQAKERIGRNESSTSDSEEEQDGAGPDEVSRTTRTIAAKLGVSSGPELILAAAARRSFVLGKHSSTRRDLLEEMQTASTYYRVNYRKNMTQNIQALIKADKLVETAKETYSLSATTSEELKIKLAT